MRRSVIALIVSIVLLSGGLYFLNSEDSNSLLTMKEEQPSKPSQDKTQQPKQTTPASSANGSPEESTSPQKSSSKRAVPNPQTTENATEKPSKPTNLGNSEGNKPLVQPTEPQKPTESEKPVVSESPTEGQDINTSIKGLSPLFYKGLQIDVIGVKVKVQSRIL